MDKQTFDAVSIITALILVPVVCSSAYAYLDGQLSFQEYVSLWREPVALMLGFWFRGFGNQTGTP